MFVQNNAVATPARETDTGRLFQEFKNSAF